MCKKLSVLAIGLLFLIFTGTTMAQELTDEEQLGKSIFFDENLSIKNNQSCAVCHTPEAGWTGPISEINAGGAVYEGSIPGRFGNRKPPSSAYATPSPILHFVIEKKEAIFIGGNFWDGRATGEKLDNPAADQAQGPFLNPLEQALATPTDVVARVCAASYGDLFRQVWGDDACDPANVNMAYNDIALSIAAYEASPEVNAFSSKYDHTFKGLAKLTKQERRGFALFRGKGKCHRCHISNGKQALFTDFTYDNLGVPRNPENPFYEQTRRSILTALIGSMRAWVDSWQQDYRTTRPMRMRIWASRRSRPCVTSARVPVKPSPKILIASSKPMPTTATSRASRALCTFTTPGTPNPSVRIPSPLKRMR